MGNALALPAPKLTDEVYAMDALDFLRCLPEASVDCCISSPPYYGLRDYGINGQIGLEETPAAFVARVVDVYREVKRVLKPGGTCWINLGDSYASGEIGRHDQKAGLYLAGHGSVKGYGQPRQQQKLDANLPSKNLLGIPWRVAFALQDDGWILRSDIIWAKPNPMPESVTDRPTKAHEYVFLLTKEPRYFYDAEAVREKQDPKSLDRLRSGWKGDKKRDWPGSNHNNFDRYMGKSDDEIAALPGRNKRTVWNVPTESTPFAHFATFPQKLIEPMILAGCPAGGLVLDPFMGSGTTAIVARRVGRHYIGCDLNPAYVQLAQERLSTPFTRPMLTTVTTAPAPVQAALWEA